MTCRTSAFSSFPLLRLFGEAEKIEAVWILEAFPREIGLRFGQAEREVGHGRAAALPQARFNLHHQNVAGPAVLNRLCGIPAAGLGAGQLVQQRQLVIPRQLCKHRLHKFPLRPRLGKSPHVFEVARRKPLHLWEGGAQVVRQPLDDPGAPALRRLPGQDVPPDLPVEQHQFPVDRQRSALTGGVDALLELGQPSGVAFRRSREGYGSFGFNGVHRNEHHARRSPGCRAAAWRRLPLSLPWLRIGSSANVIPHPRGVQRHPSVGK